MTSRFFAEDTIALIEDPSILATVIGTWRDPDSVIHSHPERFLHHDGVTGSALRECLSWGHVPAGHAIIEFIEPFKGEALIKESELILKDRGIVVGDVVKRLPSDPASGSVIKTSIQCTIEPIYTDSLYHGTDPWPHKPEENTMCLPAEELQYTEIEHGAFVFYRNWFGEVTNKFEEVTIRLENGSVVRVLNPYELQVPNYMKYARSDNKGSLASILNRARTRLEADGTSPPLQDLVEDFFPGQIVHTKKSNLRLGSWVIGSYSPQVPPRGVIVEARVVSIQVDWMTNNFNGGPLHQAMPDEILGIHELQEVKVFSGYGIEPAISGTLYGSRYASNAGVGDKVRFRDISGACTKYSGDSPIHRTHGVFRRIPRMITQGFDMNVFTVKDTKTTVVVQWQDGSVTEQDSKSLVPYMNVDENDVWIGELVSIKSAEVKESGVLRLTEVGVVQAVDARERLARVRWYQAPKVMFLPDEPSTLLPETYLGELSSRETSVSLYEVNAYPPLARRRGDMVLIKPNELHKVSILHQDPAQSIAQSTTKNMAHLSCDVEVPSMPGAYDEDTHPMQDDRDQTLDQPEDSSTNTIPSKASVQDLRWLGEIVDLGLDGLLTIRLGAVEPIEDVKVPVDQVVLVVGGDDEDFSSEDEDEDEDEDEYDDSSEYGSQYDPDESPGLILMNRGRNSNHVIEETVVYEGGERLDSAPEDAWMTSDEEPLGDDSKADDGQGDEDHEMPDVQKDDRITRINEESPERTELPHTSAFNDAMIAHSRSSSESRLKLESYNEYNFSRFPDMPQQFEILDETPPTDHHFLSKTSSGLSASLLRRISKEHGIIKDSLPAGIWARTWAERLDLVRVLIIGPQGTPYKLAPFVFDFYFPPSFPSVPPEAHFHSWTSGARINPNLYEDGKVCLSVLGTWPEGDKNEGWNPGRSSLLQVVVSLLGLVLVEEPFYNEAGFESLIGSEDTIVPSRIYSEKALCMAKGFVDYALANDLAGLGLVVRWVYVSAQGPLLLKEVVRDSKALLIKRDDNFGVEDGHIQERLSKGAEFLLRKHLVPLESRLAALEAA